MAVEIDVLLSLEEAERAANEWQDNFVQNAQQATGKSEAELKRWSVAVKREIEKSKQSMERFANNARGVVGDVGDAVGALGEGLLGLSKSQQEVADKTAYMAEKGMALGAAVGSIIPGLGTLVGSGIGFVAGGLLGFWAGNAEQAADSTTNLNKQLEEQQKKLNRVIDLWARADVAKSGTQALTESWYGLRTAIDDTIDAEDLSSKSKAELERRAKTSGDMLKSVYDGIGTKAVEVANLETELARAKTKHFDDAYAASWAVREVELKLAKATEEHGVVQAQVNAQMSEYANVTGELESRQQGVAKAAAKLTEITREQMDAIVALERAQEERLAGVGGGPEARLAAEYEAEQEARQANLDMVHHFMNLEIVAAQEQAARMVAIAQTEQERISHIRMTQGLTVLEQQKAKEAAIIEEYEAVVNGALDNIGQMAMSAIGGVATDAFNSWLETIATGEKDADRSFKKIAAAFLRSIGQQLVADGIKNILMGTAEAIAGRRKTGLALIAVGGGEIAAGAAMGAGGAAAQRRQGYGDDQDRGSLGRGNSSRGSGTVVQAPTVIQINSLTPGDKRAWQEAGRVIEESRKAYHNL